ncbi:MCE family protein [Prevotella scopos JCM 17725]|jgi:hypothetical protein|uniref:Phospholipid/cholesterol/gamma-HCH transport system substrate-binding protein n=1 Tax=Prevotella scopos JCM 17725 TaxID=1236518 RepID=A0AAX2F6V0_9BACT|nr:MlaD family protein [Prevotella scopos]ANR73711.1 mammalian cell entry protein [Prevotella scopos JCM 17725]QUB44297.1 MCE family protein [Prevotella scopos JCM 17725]SHG08876.1 phospholipid/cholesterol/gamma-HCH transport system substrate-binding protein [Prevotella scopos JCM 17725]
MKKFFTPQVKIALVAILAVVVLFLGMQFLKGLSLFSNDAHYKIKFDDITGLSNSTPVYARGFKVGIVRNINYDYDKLGELITVDINVDRTLRIPEGTTAEIISDIMGNVKVELKFAKNSQILKENGWIDGRINDGTLGDLKSMVPSFQKMLPKVDSILGSVNALLADPALKSSMHNIDKITNDLTTSTRELNTLLAQVNGSLPSLVTKTGRVMDNANGLMNNANRGITEARGAIRGANTMMATLNNKVDGVDVEGTMARVNATIDNLNAFTAKLNSGEGSMGLLLNDASLYNNLNNTVRSADSLLTNLKAHPKRYVHFSIFGRKDK